MSRCRRISGMISAPARRRTAAGGAGGEGGEIYVIDVGPRYRGLFFRRLPAFAVDRKPTDAQMTARRRDRRAREDRRADGQARRPLPRHLPGGVRSLLQMPGRKFPHHLGHGVGLQPHEFPHLNPKWDDVLMEGEVFTAEPGCTRRRSMAGSGWRIDYHVTAERRGESHPRATGASLATYSLFPPTPGRGQGRGARCCVAADAVRFVIPGVSTIERCTTWHLARPSPQPSPSEYRGEGDIETTIAAVAMEHEPQHELRTPRSSASRRRASIRIAAALFVGFAIFFVLLYVVLSGWWFRWVILVLGVWSSCTACGIGSMRGGRREL